MILEFAHVEPWQDFNLLLDEAFTYWKWPGGRGFNSRRARHDNPLSEKALTEKIEAFALSLPSRLLPVSNSFQSLKMLKPSSFTRASVLARQKDSSQVHKLCNLIYKM